LFFFVLYITHDKGSCYNIYKLCLIITFLY